MFQLQATGWKDLILIGFGGSGRVSSSTRALQLEATNDASTLEYPSKLCSAL